MSAISHGVKFRFVGFLRNMFRKSTEGGDVVATATNESVASPAAAAPASNGNGNGEGSASIHRRVEGITLPLNVVLAILPLELRGKIRQADAGEHIFTVAFEKVLPQLASGMVKVAFGEVRRAAPQVFAPGVESDAVAVVLPLNEILSRLNPVLLTRRPVQKQVAVPEEIASPFTGRGEGLALSVGNPQTQASAAPAFVAPVPVTSVPRARAAFAATATTSAQTEDTSLFQRMPARAAGSGAIAATAAPAEAPPLQRVPARPAALITPVKPAAPVPSTATVPDTAIFHRKSDPLLVAATPDAAGLPPRPKDYLAHPPVARAMQPARPAQPTPPPAGAEVLSIPVPLAALAEAWPEALRQEIVQLNLAEARVALPAELIEASLKRGRVVFPWKIMRSWIRPAPAPSVSAHDATELELSLSVVAPLFLARQKASGKQQRAVVDETIPNLFFGLPKPEPAQTPKPSDTNYYVWAETSDQARVDDSDYKRKGPSGTDFVSKYATPNEIVSRAAVLDGVAGVLIALPDGLMVASRIPPEFNGDTLAAFLPQIFSKVSSTTKELRMGDLNNLNFTVGNVPWKIFRVNAIFFAAFGRTGETLPTAELAGLAAELDRKR